MVLSKKNEAVFSGADDELQTAMADEAFFGSADKDFQAAVAEEQYESASEGANYEDLQATIFPEQYESASEGANYEDLQATVFPEQDEEAVSIHKEKNSADTVKAETQKNNIGADSFIQKAVEMMTKATAKTFKNIALFKRAAENISELCSANGVIYKKDAVINSTGGESVVLKCSTENGVECAAKIYYSSVDSGASSIKARKRTLEFMRTDTGKKYTLAVQDVGVVELNGGNYYFEITEYISDGDVLKKAPMKYADIAALTRDISELLAALHRFDIIHRDIKPGNIYFSNGVYKLGDFGVAAVLSKEGAVFSTVPVGTIGYSAPESRQMLVKTKTFRFDTKCDYYSLGTTIATLFEGSFIYSGMNEAEISDRMSKMNIPLTVSDQQGEYVKNIVHGLCAYSPVNRFGYEEVKMWLSNNGYSGLATWSQPLQFSNVVFYNSAKELFYGIVSDQEHWAIGIKYLYNERFKAFFGSFNPYLSSRASDICDEWRANRNTFDRNKGLADFLRSLYPIGPIVWRGYTFNSPADLAVRMLSTKKPQNFADILREKIVSSWLEGNVVYTVSDDKKNKINVIEEYAKSQPEIACYWFGNTFSNNKLAMIFDRELTSFGSVINVLFESPRKFYLDGGLEVLTSRQASFYGYLYSFGVEDIIENTWQLVQDKQIGMSRKICLYISMIDQIAERIGANTSDIRSFFIKYSPVAGTIYVRQLILNEGEAVYKALDDESREIISEIENFRNPVDKSVKDMLEEYSDLANIIDRFRKKLVGNPYNIGAGAYLNRGILCNDLRGVFAFKFYDEVFPIGFSDVLEHPERGGY